MPIFFTAPVNTRFSFRVTGEYTSIIFVGEDVRALKSLLSPSAVPSIIRISPALNAASTPPRATYRGVYRSDSPAWSMVTSPGRRIHQTLGGFPFQCPGFRIPGQFRYHGNLFDAHNWASKLPSLSISTLLNRFDVRQELCKADWVSVKIDTVDETIWKNIVRPPEEQKLLVSMYNNERFYLRTLTHS